MKASTRIKYIFNITEGMFSWATAPILLFILGRLPLAVAGPEIKATVIAQNAPFVLETLMTIGMLGILVSGLLSVFLLPERPHEHSRFRYIIMFLQWILLPITVVLFGSIPAVDAQTRLSLGKYLGFFVTPKSRQ